jgi:Spy/CpxP family protein refolding chaperone
VASAPFLHADASSRRRKPIAVEIPTMNRFALTLGVAAGALAMLAVGPGINRASMLQAQNPAPPASPAAPAQATELPADFKPLFDGITLTEVQNRQAVTIVQKHMSMAQTKPDSAKPGMGAGAVDHRVEAAKELRNILTPDQQKIFDKNLDKVKATWGKPGY